MAVAALVSSLSCVDGGPVGEDGSFDRTAPVLLVPRYQQLSGVSAEAGAVDRIRLTARNGAGTVLATTDVAVDPTASSWSLPFDIPVPAEGADVTVSIELISGGVVEWSGRLGPIRLSAGQQVAQPREVPVFRGPLDNLDVLTLGIRGAPASLGVGASAQLSAELTVRDGTPAPTVFWTTSDPAVATVSASGLVTALAAGTVTIGATAGPASDQVTFPVRAAPAGVQVTPATASADRLNGELSFQASVLDALGNPIVDSPVAWTSSDPRVLSHLERGRFLVVGNGTARAVATASEDPSVSGSAAVTVRQTIAEMVVSPARVTMTRVGAQETLDARPVDAGGSAVADARLSFTSGNPAVAQVSPAGVLTAVGTGTTTITVVATDPAPAGAQGTGAATTAATVTRTVEVVVELALEGLRVRPERTVLTGPGATAQLTAELIQVGGETVPAPAATWTSADPAVVTVSQTGRVTAVSRGTTTVQAAASGQRGSATVVVGGPDLVVSNLVVVPDGPDGTVIDPTRVTVEFSVRNAGNVTAGASTAAIRLVDATTNVPQVLDQAIAVPELAPGRSFAVNAFASATQPLPNTDPQAVIVEAVADARDVVDESDENNNLARSPALRVGELEFTRQWVGGAPQAATDWFAPRNWVPEGVPGPTDDVRIVPGELQPSLGADAVVRRLFLEPGAALRIGTHTLEVQGDLDAGTTITSDGGTVVLSGSARTLSGSVQANVRVTGQVSAKGAVSVGGDLRIQGAGAVFDVAGQSVTVGDDLETADGGVLRMTSGASNLVVADEAIFAGGNGPADANDGTLTVGDGLVAEGSNPAFVGSGSHTVVFTGGSQTLRFGFPGPSSGRLGNAIVDATATLNTGSNATVSGNLTVLGTLSVGVEHTLSVLGTLTLATGSTLNVNGTVTAGSCIDNGATITGSGSHPCLPAPTVTTTSLPPATQGVAYSQTLTATGGDGTYAWSITAGALPTGLSLNGATGVLSGTPTAAGTFNFTVQVASAGKTGIRAFSIAVGSPTLTIQTASLPGSVVGDSYSQTLQATGGDGTYAWTVSSGALPAELTLGAATGTISGTTVTAGTFTFTIQVTSGGQTATREFSIVVSFPPPTVSTTVLLNATVGTAYSTTLQAAGGDGTYLWAITTGTLPDGISLNNASGVISGTPTAAGTTNFTVQVTSAGQTATQALSLTVVHPTPAITTAAMPGGVVGTAYSHTLTATGGDGTYTWAITTGTLPNGISLDNATGVISGTPTAPGTANFTVQVTSAGQTATRALSISVTNPAPAITTAAMPGGTVGVAYSATLVAVGGDGTYTWALLDGTLPDGLSLNGTTGVVSGTPTTAQTRTPTFQVTSDGQTASRSLPITIAAAGARTWVGGSGDEPGNWLLADNWTPAVVPTAADDVIIPPTANNPSVTGATALARNLTVQTGALVNVGAGGALRVHGNLDAGQTITGSGTVHLQGTTGTARGTMANPVEVTGAYTVDGTLVTGSMTVTGGGASLSLDGEIVSVAGDFTVQNGGVFRSTVDGGAMTVSGNASFRGGNVAGDVSEGVLSVAGDLIAGTTTPAFVSSGNHLVYLIGPSQNVSFAGSGPAAGRLNDVVVTAVDGTTVAGDLHIAGDFVVTGIFVVPSGFTVDVAGALTLGNTGTLNVDGTLTAAGGCTNLGGSILGSGSQPCGAPGVKTWVGGDAGGPTAFSNPANWSPNGVPTATDNVVIPLTGNEPIMSSDQTVQDIEVQTSATLDLGGNELTVTRDLVAPGDLSNGTTILTTSTGLAEGGVDDLVVASGANRSVSGSLTAAGNLTVQGTLSVLHHYVGVDGDLSVEGSNGRLVMQNSSGIVDVAGSATFAGLGTNGFLTGGSLEVEGDLTSTAAVSTQSFYATGNHQVVLDGGLQTITLANTTNQFANLTSTGTANVTLPSTVTVDGVLTVDGSSLVSGNVLQVGGGIDDTGGGLSVGSVRLTGNPTILPANLTAALLIDAGVDLPNDVALTGNVTVSQVFDLNTHALDVDGDLTVSGAAARLVMQNSTDALTVSGDVTIDGTTTNGFLTDGILTVHGSFSAGSTFSTRSFLASGAHTVIVEDNGGTPVTVGLTTPGDTDQRFQNLTITEFTDVTFTSHIVVDGLFQVDQDNAVNASGFDLYVGGGWTDQEGPTLFDQVALTGNVSALPPTIQSDVFVDALVTLPSNTTISGDLTVRNTLDIGGRTLTVDAGGNVVVSGPNGRLVMQDVSGVFDADNDITFDGTGHNGYLTSGTLRVGGAFTSLDTHSTEAFEATGTHTVVFDGGVAQAVDLANADVESGQRFKNMTVTNGSAVTATSTLPVDGNLTVDAGSSLDATTIEFTDGSFSDVGGGITTELIDLYGGPAAFPSTVDADVFIGADWDLPGTVTVYGDVQILRPFNPSGNTFTVVGNVDVSTSTGRIEMFTVGDLIDVDGDLTIDGGPTVGYLTDGTLRVSGNFLALANNSSTSFQAGGSHTVIMDGTGSQYIDFAVPGHTTQKFENLTIENGDGTVDFLSDVRILDAFEIVSGAVVDASGTTVSVGGSWTSPLDNLTVQTLELIGSVTALPNFPYDFDLLVSSSFSQDDIGFGLTVNGNVTVEHSFIVGNHLLTVNGNLSTGGTSGRLVMLDGDGGVDVNGNATFDGASHASFLTQGTLSISGDLTVSNTQSTVSLAGTTSHTVQLDGASAQTVSFSNPGRTTQRFQNLTVTNSSGPGVTFATDVVVFGFFNDLSVAGVDATGHTVSVGNGISEPNQLTANALEFFGTVSALPATLTFNEVIFDTPVNLNTVGNVTVNGNLTTNSILTVGSASLDVTGHFSVLTANGVLDMGDSDGGASIGGNVLFDGASHATRLTEGGFSAAGNFTVTQSHSPQSFVSTGTTVTLDGTGPQAVSLSSSGTQTFARLRITNTTAPITLLTNIEATEEFEAGAGTEVRGVSPRSVTVSGSGFVDVDGLTMDNVSMRVESTGLLTLHQFDNVTFENMSASATQLYLRLAGPGIGTLFMFGVDFDPLTGGDTGLYVDAGASNLTAWALGLPTDPGNGSSFQSVTNGVSIFWGP